MARTIEDRKLDTRAARQRLKKRREPWWRSISEGLSIGYRKGATGGTWIARHYSPEHGRRYHSIGTSDDVVDADGVHVFSFDQAQKESHKWFADLARQDGGEVRPGPFTVKACVDEYLTWLKEHRKDGRNSRYRADALILPVLGHIQCDKLTTEQIEKWLRDIANSPALLRSRKDAKKRNTRKLDKSDTEAIRRRRSSANRTWTILRAALNRAWRKHKIHSDDAWRRVEPFEEVDGARVRYLSVAEAKRLVNACESDFRKLVQGALVTGARYGELASLRASDFNPDSHTVHVRTSKSGKGRHIVLNDEGVALFKSLVAGKPSDALLLPKRDGSSWAAAHQIRPMADASKHAKINPPISFHGLRHTYASLAIMNGVPLMVVAKNLGHSDTRMVEKHYGHLAQNFITDAIRKGAPTFGIEPETDVVSIDERRTKGTTS
jgi:integrase